MRRFALLPAVWFADRLAGDPEWFPHPVRLIGFAISRAENDLRRPARSNAYNLIAGATVTTAIVATAYATTAKALRIAHRRSIFLGHTTEVLLGWTCLAGRNLQDEAAAVLDALERGNLPHARHRLARIVGRNTENLDEAEICRAVIETLAESASDGIVAPMFYMALGGVPLAMAYKAVNTLDSMIGHADARHLWFGKAAARLDDAANFLPARLTAAALIIVAAMDRVADAQAAVQTWRRDGSKHKSPNAGHPESAMAGALRVKLGGRNTYGGETIEGPILGEMFPQPSLPQARHALRLVSNTTLLAVASACVVALAWYRNDAF